MLLTKSTHCIAFFRARVNMVMAEAASEKGLGQQKS